jgi:RND family efflux transporter MFP subunit
MFSGERFPVNGCRAAIAMVFSPPVRRGVLSVVGVTLVLALAGGVYGRLAALRQPAPERTVEPKAYNVEALRVEAIDYPEILTGFGTARAGREVVLSAEVVGQIIDIHPRLDVGIRVRGAEIGRDNEGRTDPRPGELLCQIDSDTYRRKFEQAEARLRTDETERGLIDQQEANTTRLLDKSRLDYRLNEEEYNRIEGLRKKNVTSESDLTKARLDLQRYRETVLGLENDLALYPNRREQLERRLDMHRADLELAKLELARTEVRPPFTGVLAEVMIERGQHVKVGDPLVKLVDLSHIDVAISLPLEESSKLTPLLLKGETPRVTLSENEQAPPRWTGNVVRISPKADEATRTVKVYVEVDNSRQTAPLLPGTFVFAKIQGPVRVGVTLVPRDAMIRGGVLVATDGRSFRRELKLGDRLRTVQEVKSGLVPGEEVILTNLDVLTDGARVNVRKSRSASEELLGHAATTPAPAQP